VRVPIDGRSQSKSCPDAHRRSRDPERGCAVSDREAYNFETLALGVEAFALPGDPPFFNAVWRRLNWVLAPRLRGSCNDGAVRA
jgi:hypothetical protein